MVKYVDKNVWVEQVLMPDESTPILGGTPDWDDNNMLAGWSNVPAGQLADRTRFLKERVEGLEQDIETGSDNALQKDNNLSDLQDVGQAKFNLGINLVDNIRDLDKPVSNLTQEALNAKVDKVVGMGLSQESFTTSEKNKLLDIEAGAQVNTVTSVAGKQGAVTLVKGDVGLGNVDNTSDASKPISTATQNALNTKAAVSHTHDAANITSGVLAVERLPALNATKANVLGGTNNLYVSGGTYLNVISWNDMGSLSANTSINLDTSLNHRLTAAASLTLDATNVDPGKTGDIVINTPTAVTVSWTAKWKFLGSVPNIGGAGETWVVSYKVFDANTIYAAAVKVA